MPAFSFKERFVPMVKDGSKCCTIRSFRKYPVKVGQLAHLYYGMRTKFCTKLVEPAPVISFVRCILIPKNGQLVVINTNWIAPEVRSLILAGGDIGVLLPDVKWTNGWSKELMDIFAWEDGFRHSDDMNMAAGCYDLMLRYWRQNGGLPFLGFQTFWNK